MSDENVFAHHHDFFGTHPALEPKQDDTKDHERANNRAVIARGFLDAEGPARLKLLRNLAAYTPAHPIDYTDPGKTNQLLLWSAARVALVDELEKIIEQETKR